MENKYAFISYQTNDIDDAYWVKKVLIENGINCWMAPDSIPGGSSYADEIDDAINGCTVFVLVLSEQTQHSKWVKKELDRAINTGKLVLPFMIENIVLFKGQDRLVNKFTRGPLPLQRRIKTQGCLALQAGTHLAFYTLALSLYAPISVLNVPRIRRFPHLSR